MRSDFSFKKVQVSQGHNRDGGKRVIIVVCLACYVFRRLLVGWLGSWQLAPPRCGRSIIVNRQ